MEMIDTMECTFFEFEHWGKFFELETVFYKGRVPNRHDRIVKVPKKKDREKSRTEYDARSRLILSLTK